MTTAIMAMEDKEELAKLRLRVAELETEVAAMKSSDEAIRREKIDKMSSEVVDSNPYR